MSRRHNIPVTAYTGILMTMALLLGSCTKRTQSMIHLDNQHLVRISESVWRQAASRHQERIRTHLSPGFTPLDHPLNSGLQRNRNVNSSPVTITALDPKHPIYNFLIEYYGLKGVKGPRRMMRWSPSPGILLQDETLHITNLDCMDRLADHYITSTATPTANKVGILLEGVKDEDFASNLHLRGAYITNNGDAIYSPSWYFGRGDEARSEENARLADSFLWYRTILQKVLSSEPVLHCYGLHEWAMQYQPENSPPPPSAKYQQHLPLRVSRQVINDTVERKGISCTHVDALRFFAEAANPLNRFGAGLHRNDQVRLEQSGCVHAHMDLLKMALKIQPFCDPTLLERVLETALDARRLDVAASPYDASSYGVGVVAIDTPEGRALYRNQQIQLMKQAEPVRRNLLRAYDCILSLAFDQTTLDNAQSRLPQNATASV